MEPRRPAFSCLADRRKRMRSVRVAHSAAVLYLASTLVASVISAQGTTPAPAPAQRMMGADEVVWGPAPPGLPPGSKMTVLSGDPGQPGPFTARAQLPAGYHPVDDPRNAAPKK